MPPRRKSTYGKRPDRAPMMHRFSSQSSSPLVTSPPRPPTPPVAAAATSRPQLVAPAPTGPQFNPPPNTCNHQCQSSCHLLHRRRSDTYQTSSFPPMSVWFETKRKEAQKMVNEYDEYDEIRLAGRDIAKVNVKSIRKNHRQIFNDTERRTGALAVNVFLSNRVAEMSKKSKQLDGYES